MLRDFRSDPRRSRVSGSRIVFYSSRSSVHLSLGFSVVRISVVYMQIYAASLHNSVAESESAEPT